jgi:hypothetical protein
MRNTDYYRRRSQDGTYETICTQCFATLGPAGDLVNLSLVEAAHACRKPIRKIERRHQNDSVTGEPLEQSIEPQPFLAKPRTSAVILVLFALVLCLYVLPTVIELELVGPLGAWVSCILFGDIAGCLFLALFLGMRKFGALLYLVLTAIEGGLYVNRLLPVRWLPWVVDSVPTLAVTVLISISLFKPGACRLAGMGQPAKSTSAE